MDPDDPGAIPPARTPALKPGRIAVSEVLPVMHWFLTEQKVRMQTSMQLSLAAHVIFFLHKRLWGCWQAKAEEPRGPKKLSDVKVNPSIAASLGQLPVPAARSTNSTALAAQSTPAPAAADLLLQLDGPAPGQPPGCTYEAHDCAGRGCLKGNRHVAKQPVRQQG